MISSHPEIAERLSLQLETWAEILRAESDRIPFEFSDEEIQHLRALGYVQ